MKFIDTHTHLYLKQFSEDIDTVIANSIEKGIDKLLLPNINSETTKDMLNLCNKYPKTCYAMMGLHPCDVKSENMEKELLHVEEMLQKNKFVAVGEIGIDLYWDKSNLPLQKEAFIFQINLAKKYQLPIVIHVRDSFEQAITVVENLNDDNLSGVFHCFTGNIKDAKRITDLGNFYLGIGGVLTFKNSGLDNTIKEIDITHLLLETDSPYLAPTPFRGKRNESKYIVNIAEKLSQIHQIRLQDIAEITTNNALKLFKI